MKFPDLDELLHDFDCGPTQTLDSWALHVKPHELLDQLHELDAALGGWQRWPSGGPITVAELGDTVIVLEGHFGFEGGVTAR